MEAAERDSTCLGMFDCLSAKESLREQKESLAHKRASRRIGMNPMTYPGPMLTTLGVERPMRLTYNQPHLIEPMKLTVYDVIPMTPVPQQRSSHVSKLVEQGRKSLSRASTKATRRTKSSISKPQATLSAEGCQLRRNPSFRPLQLSIYMADKRLSDLPEFDAVSFTEQGEIRTPPRALVRTHSEDLLRARSPTSPEVLSCKPASMFEQTLSRRISHLRHNTNSTVISSSRPASEYDALHSHPVSWYAVPGVPPSMQFATAPSHSKKILSPMQEEFTPPPSGAVIINGKILAFPDVDASRVITERAHQSLLPPALGQEDDPAAPSPVIDPGPNRRTTVITQHKAQVSEAASILLASSAASTRTRATTMETSAQPFNDPQAYFHTDFKTNNRINQWLDSEKPAREERSRESSISTIKTTTTTSSFAEHRRKRSNFYQLNQSKEAGANSPTKSGSLKSTKTPTPLTLYRPFPPQKATNANPQPYVHETTSSSNKAHTRTHTESTVASSIATDILFETPETPELERDDVFSSAQALPQKLSKKAYDAESMTTIDMKSRTGTMKSSYTASSNRQRSPSPVANQSHKDAASEVTAADQFVFRDMTPSPCTDSPQTPLSAKTKDVEKLMFEMCAQGGFRRVNVGVAF